MDKVNCNILLYKLRCENNPFIKSQNDYNKLLKKACCHFLNKKIELEFCHVDTWTSVYFLTIFETKQITSSSDLWTRNYDWF